MLSDPNTPKSIAIFAASRELDALRCLWQEGKYSSPEAEPHLNKLQSINVDQFHDSDFIRKHLNKLRQSMAAKQQGDETAEKEFNEVVAKLESEEGFLTEFI